MSKSAEFPKCVYGPNEGEWMTIHSWEELPEGWSEEPGGDPVELTEEAKTEAKEANDKAKEATKEHRDALKAFLDEHAVEYDGRAATEKLEDLTNKLNAHLAKPQPSISTPG